jgi:triacylglycerol lipase
MYFPSGFDLDRALELGGLVDQAYKQFEAFFTGKPWQLPIGYSLKKELTYRRPAGKISIKVSSYLDLDLRGLRQAGRQTAKDVPIGFLAQRRECVFLIFRGTISDQEWFHNIGISLVPYWLPDFGKIHDGFLLTYNLLHAAIKESLDDVAPRSKLFIAGHSLGGALATIALPDVEARIGRKVVALYTYGSPRVGDNSFVTAFNRNYAEKSFRIINTSDMVGLIPPPASIAGTVGGYFSHVDTPVVFTVQHDDVVKNHEMKTYLSALRDSKSNKGILNKLKLRFT